MYIVGLLNVLEGEEEFACIYHENHNLLLTLLEDIHTFIYHNNYIH